MDAARALLRRPAARPEPVWPTLLAAGFFAASALVFAASALLAPPMNLSSASERPLRGIN
jgi:hypothetical protein